MDCRATVARKFRIRLGDSFEGENMQTRYKVLICRIDSYFHNCIDYDKKQKNDKKQQNFIRTAPDKEDFDIFKAVNQIFSRIK